MHLLFVCFRYLLDRNELGGGQGHAALLVLSLLAVLELELRTGVLSVLLVPVAGIVEVVPGASHFDFVDICELVGLLRRRLLHLVGVEGNLAWVDLHGDWVLALVVVLHDLDQLVLVVGHLQEGDHRGRDVLVAIPQLHSS